MVLALDVYHHFDYPEKMLAAIHKALQAGWQAGGGGVLQAPEAMPGGRAMTHIRLDMPDVIKEIEANHFHLVKRNTSTDCQYMLILEKS